MAFSSVCAREVVEPSSGHAGQKAVQDSASEMPKADVAFGFRKNHRLCKTDEFSSVFAFRKTIKGQYFEVLYRTNSSGTSRLGIIVGKQFVRSAVNRNLIKRIVRESFRLTRTQLNYLDLIVRVKHRITCPERAFLKKEINFLLNKFRRQ